MYNIPEVKTREWYVTADMSKYIALIINTLYRNKTMSDLLNPVKRIEAFLEKNNKEYTKHSK